MERLRELYRRFAQQDPLTEETITGSGSNRLYYRFTAANGQSVIGVIGTSLDENHAFIYLARHFYSLHLY